MRLACACAPPRRRRSLTPIAPSPLQGVHSAFGFVRTTIDDAGNAGAKHVKYKARGQHNRAAGEDCSKDAPCGVITRNQYRNKTCFYLHRARLRRARRQKEFRDAERVVLMADTSASNTADLVAALKRRNVARTHLCAAVYHSPPWARARYHARCAERKELDRIIHMLCPTVRLCALLCACCRPAHSHAPVCARIHR